MLDGLSYVKHVCGRKHQAVLQTIEQNHIKLRRDMRDQIDKFERGRYGGKNSARQRKNKEKNNIKRREKDMKREN